MSYLDKRTTGFCPKHAKSYVIVMFSDGMEVLCEDCAREEYLKLKYVEPGCQLPPEGWYCTRDAGHEGPCAAWPMEKL